MAKGPVYDYKYVSEGTGQFIIFIETKLKYSK